MGFEELHYKAYTGEAKAALRLKVYADKAEQEGYPQIAKLFRVISMSEEIHGGRALRALKAVKSTEENLAASFESEVQVAEVAYGEIIKKASEEGDKLAEKIYTQARDVEDVHSKLYKKAMTHMLDESETTYHVCKLCGYVSDTILPDKCPVCGAKSERFFSY